MNLRRCEEEHTIHNEDKEWNEPQDEEVGRFCSKGGHIIVIEPLYEPFHEIKGRAVCIFWFHNPSPFFYIDIYYSLSIKNFYSLLYHFYEF